MAEGSGNSSSTPWLAFLVGGLIVIVAVIGYFMYTGGQPATPKSVDVNIEAPKLPDAPAVPSPGG